MQYFLNTDIPGPTCLTFSNFSFPIKCSECFKYNYLRLYEFAEFYMSIFIFFNVEMIFGNYIGSTYKHISEVDSVTLFVHVNTVCLGQHLFLIKCLLVKVCENSLSHLQMVV